jgi:hypothetical protein
MLAPSREASRKTTYRFIASRSDSAYGRGELSVAHSADPRRIAEARNCISARTVSRYLRGRPPRRSQTWRTFFANHFGDPTPISPVMFPNARGDDVVVDASDGSLCPTQLSIGASVMYPPAIDRLGRRIGRRMLRRSYA